MKKLLIPLLILLTLFSFTVISAGNYGSWQQSRDGSDVACGGQYGSWQQSRDGSSVCVGGQYGSWQQSRDGSDVAAQWNGD
jgi:hypothetical protein